MKIKRIKTDKFRTNEVGLFIAIPMKSHTFTMNALLPNVLMRGSNNYSTQLDINKKLDELYGAELTSYEEKVGNYYVLNFFMDVIANKYVNAQNNLLQEAVNVLIDIIFNPLVKEDGFDAKYVEQEKKNLSNLINMRKDDKARYASTRAIEEQFKDEPYGQYIRGNLDDLSEINEKNLYEYYLKIINESKIYMAINGEDADDVLVSKKIEIIGDDKWDGLENNDINYEKHSDEINESCEIEEKHKSNAGCEIEEKHKINAGCEIEEKHKSNASCEIEEKHGIVKKVVDELDVTQGKINIILSTPTNNKYTIMVYNMILGGDANSKLFQNVREKNGLAYTVRSQYVKQKNFIMISTGIMLDKFQKCYEVIIQQLQDLKDGKITEDELKNAKETIFASLKLIPESQNETISYEYHSDLFNENVTLEEYEKKIKEVTIDEVVKIANEINVELVYYLTNSNKENSEANNEIV